MKKYIFLMACFIFQNNYSEQFVYPVGDFDDKNQIMLLYQKSVDDIELWIWNSHNHTAVKGLSSFLTPANLRMLPSGKGFSFIDQGYIKIKEFSKRSARTLPIYEPIGLFSNMNWIDDETFYFVARQGDYFQIFQGDVQANIQQLTYELADALYPQKIGSQLFYLQRDIDHNMSVITRPWNFESNESVNTIALQNLASQPCFLKMINETQGFYIQAPTHKSDSIQDCYEFSCYYIFKQNDAIWLSDKLFTFTIPSKYIIGSDRLYESIEPFLPNYTRSGYVYYNSWDHDLEQFKLYSFDIAMKNTEIISNIQLYKNKETKFFAPYLHHDKMYCGIILEEKRTNQNIFEDGDMDFELPFFITKK